VRKQQHQQSPQPSAAALLIGRALDELRDVPSGGRWACRDQSLSASATPTSLSLAARLARHCECRTCAWLADSSLAIFTCTLLPAIHPESNTPPLSRLRTLSPPACCSDSDEASSPALLDRAPRCLRSAVCLPWTTHPIGPKLSCWNHFFLAHPPPFCSSTPAALLSSFCPSAS
jgi:hypothetical protein